MAFCPDENIKLDYLNGKLSEKESSRLEEHLAACPECRREIAALRETAAAVAGLTPPSVPDAWAAAAKDRLRAMKSSPVAAVPSRPASLGRKTNVFQYGAIAAGVTAGLVLLFWLVMGGAVRSWLPGLSATALVITEPRAARIVDIVTWVLSLHALVFVPSIVDNIYRLVRRGDRKFHFGSSAGFFAC